jgi:hypothetical protein
MRNHRLVPGSVALVLCLGTSGSFAATKLARIDALCSKSEAPWGLVETDFSRKLKMLIESLPASKTRISETEIQVFGPSRYCSGPYSPALEAIRAKVRNANDEEARGNRARAQQLRTEARAELVAFWRSLSARGGMSIQASRFSQGGGQGSSASSGGSAADMDGYMKDSLETARTAETLGDEQTAQDSIDKAGQEYEQWSENEQARMREEASAQAEQGYIDPAQLQEMLDIARTNQLLRDSVAAQQLDLAKLGNVLAKRFKRMAKKMPCPPDANVLKDLATAGREAAMLGTDDEMILATQRPHINNYVRAKAQGADAATRHALATQAALAGLDQLSQDLLNGAKIDPPQCKKNEWTGTINYRRNQSRHSQDSRSTPKPANGTETTTGDAKETYTATITIPADGPPTA